MTTSRKKMFADQILLFLTIGLLPTGLALTFYYSPLLRHTGLPWWSQKIFYIHLPCAWGALSGLLLVLIGSVAYLKTQKESWDTFALSAAEICFVFATGVLITGPIWARPSWNVYWRWEDPRLMSFFALWLVLGSYFLLRRFGVQGQQLRTISAVLGIIGALSVPFVYMSVKYGQAFHPDPAKLQVGIKVRLTIWVCNFAFFFLFVFLMRFRRSLEDMKNRSRRLHMKLQELENE